MKSNNRVGYTPANEYYTPAWIFEGMALRFDLDVCSPKDHVTAVPADKFYTIDDDGLSSDWTGRVWMNPPYSSPTEWIDKFIEHGNGVCLVAMSRSKAFLRLWDAVDGMVALTSNLSFITPEGKKKGIFMPCAIAAIGADNVEGLKRLDAGKVR